jgi:ketosteroid isomerase-like protein
MSQENVEVVRQVLEAQRRRDWAAFRRLYDPGIEWEDVSGLWEDWVKRGGFEDGKLAGLVAPADRSLRFPYAHPLTGDPLPRGCRF